MMKKCISWMVMATTALMLTACGGKTANKQSESETNSTALTTETTDDAEGEEKYSTTGESKKIDAIRSTWASQPIAIEGSKVNIGMLAKAFCQQYADYQPNMVMLRYLNGDKNFNEGLEYEYHVLDMTSDGYMASVALLQYDMVTQCCYWNRNNGHKLAAFWLSKTYESSSMDRHLAAFYDYDPATGIMTPEPRLTKMIEQAAAPYDSYSVQLPQEGKDIMLYVYNVNEEEDYAETKDYILRWNGYDFKMEEMAAQ